MKLKAYKAPPRTLILSNFSWHEGGKKPQITIIRIIKIYANLGFSLQILMIFINFNVNLIIGIWNIWAFWIEKSFKLQPKANLKQLMMLIFKHYNAWKIQRQVGWRLFQKLSKVSDNLCFQTITFGQNL